MFIGGETLCVHNARPRKIPGLMVLAREIFFYKRAYGKKIIKRRNLTCDKAFFLNSRGKERKKGRLIQLLHGSSVRSPESGAKARASFINNDPERVKNVCS